ncbi:MAG: aminotransferase class III-fold pyridoxal phosphate-dependent enzyme [Candidatus Margulisbacteria bacterium]|nr:aminotransferase class III-fold pyridoxal phosphate-dependent enzyme [Candidatus Margulisiibacteriota bacterium]
MKKLVDRVKKVVSPVLGRYFADFEVDRGQGCYLFGSDGKKYLDFSSGIASCSTGHAHPKVVAAAQKQLKKLIHICIGVALYEPYIALAEKLRAIVPIKNAQFFFCQSGSEAIEAAIKLAKYATKKPGLIAIRGAFHGRTLGALSLTTSKMKYRDGYEPLLPNVFIAEPDLKEIGKILRTKKIAGIIVEPVLGEGGYIIFPKVFIKGLRRLCNKYKALLIFDEVQTGIGRTGKWFAAEHFGVKPDIICLAKGIASGFPLGGIAASAKTMKKWSPGAHGSTFGGNPVCCAAAIATIDVIKQQKLLQNSAKLGGYLKKQLLKLKAKYSAIKDVRGLGLMIGVDFGDPTFVKQIMDYCLAQGLVLISTGGGGAVIRLVPPLIVSKQEIDKALKIIEQALNNA